MNSLLNWNDNLVAIFEAKLTFKSLSIASVGAVDTTNVPTFDVFKSNAMMVHELLMLSNFHADFLKKGEIAWETGTKTLYKNHGR